MSEEKKSLKDLIENNWKERRITLYDGEGGFRSQPIDALLSQPFEGVLYDLNRLHEVILTFIEEDPFWFNEYAVMLVMCELKKRLDEAEAKIKELETRPV